jgi:hypothetical protein
MSRPRHPNRIHFAGTHGELHLPWPGALDRFIIYVFDLADLELVEQHHWCMGRHGRLCTHVGIPRTTLYLSRHLLGATREQRVWHDNGDCRDLRRKNLRVEMVDRRTPCP